PSRNCAGDILLHGENIGELAIVLITPQIAIGAGVDEFSTDNKLISALHDAAGDDALHFQVVRHGLRVYITPFVMEDGRAGHHRKIWNLREAVDQTFGEAV